MSSTQALDDVRRDRFAGLVREVHGPLTRYAARRVEAADVDDVVAETLLVLWRRLDDVPVDAPLPWLYGVARHCVANARRARRRREALDARLAAQPSGRADGPDPDPALDEALASLGARDREVLLLWAWEDLSPAQIAVATGTSTNAVHLRLSRARRRLRAALTPTRQEPAR